MLLKKIKNKFRKWIINFETKILNFLKNIRMRTYMAFPSQYKWKIKKKIIDKFKYNF